MSLEWFRQPAGDDPGTLNLAYNAVDLPVIRGRAGDPAVLGTRPLDYAGLLESTAAIAGAFRGLGVELGHAVGVALDDPHTELLVLLAAARLGAVHVDLVPDPAQRLVVHAPHLVVTDRALDLTPHAPAAVLVIGIDPIDPSRDLTWEIALQAGRTDPAGCEPVVPGTTAYVLAEPVPVTPEPASDRFGRAIATLAAGQPVDASAGLEE